MRFSVRWRHSGAQTPPRRSSKPSKESRPRSESGTNAQAVADAHPAPAQTATPRLLRDSAGRTSIADRRLSSIADRRLSTTGRPSRPRGACRRSFVSKSTGSLTRSVAPHCACVYGAGGERDVHLTRPAAEAVGWRILCDCRDQAGNVLPAAQRWQSELLVRVPSKALEDLAAGRIYSVDQDAVDIGEIHDAALSALWRSQHAGAMDALARIAAAQEQIGDLNQQLTVAVGQARDQGVSWEAIGRAAGMSRQSAHERWGRSGS